MKGTLWKRGKTNWSGSGGGGWPQPALRRSIHWWGSAEEELRIDQSVDAETKKVAEDKRTTNEAFVLLPFFLWINGWPYGSTYRLFCC